MSKAPSVMVCPRCKVRAFTKLITAGVHSSGGRAPGNRVQYPVYNPCLPIAAGEKPGGPSQIVHSKRDLAEKCARAGLVADQI